MVVTQQSTHRYRVEQPGLPLLYVDTSVVINGRWLVERRFGLPCNLDDHTVSLARAAVASYLESVREGVQA
jgi:hypothetical protein